jgi:hypothetical protein
MFKSSRILHHILHIGILTLLIICGVYIYNLTANNGTIALSYQNDENFYTVSVKAENLKQPFFGTAFHLHYDSSNLKYDHFTLGNYFPTEISPFTLVQPKSNEIIVGISLKRGQIIQKPSGTLLKFYFKKLPNEKSHESIIGKNFSFSNTVFSTFNKERLNVENVKFKTS